MKVSAACHIHSDWSYDGNWTLAELVDEFSHRGYRVLMMTEHDRGFTPSKWQDYREQCANASSENILVLPGIEYSDAANLVHVLSWGDLPFLGENLPTSVMLEAIKQSGGVSVLAHPSRRNAWRSFDPTWVKLLSGIELWNRKTDGWRPSTKAKTLIDTTGVLPFAGLDFHDHKQLFPLAMHLDLAGAPTEDSVLKCIKEHRCQPYAFNLPLNRWSVSVMTAALAPFEAARRSGRWIYRKGK